MRSLRFQKIKMGTLILSMHEGKNMLEKLKQIPLKFKIMGLGLLILVLTILFLSRKTNFISTLNKLKESYEQELDVVKSINQKKEEAKTEAIQKFDDKLKKLEEENKEK